MIGLSIDRERGQKLSFRVFGSRSKSIVSRSGLGQTFWLKRGHYRQLLAGPENSFRPLDTYAARRHA
jgi:hypothetical protein